MIENVRGIFTRDNGFAKDRIISNIKNLGYEIFSEIHNASDHGDPQNRYRAFFVGFRNGIRKKQFNLTDYNKSEKVLVSDAIGELYNFEKKVGLYTYVDTTEEEVDVPYYIPPTETKVDSSFILPDSLKIKERE